MGATVKAGQEQPEQKPPVALGQGPYFQGPWVRSHTDPLAERVKQRGGAHARGDGPLGSPPRCSGKGRGLGGAGGGHCAPGARSSLKAASLDSSGPPPQSRRCVCLRPLLASRLRVRRGPHRSAGRAPCGRPTCPGTFYWPPFPSPPQTTSCPRTSSWPYWAPAAWARAVSAAGTRASAFHAARRSNNRVPSESGRLGRGKKAGAGALSVPR